MAILILLLFGMIVGALCVVGLIPPFRAFVKQVILALCLSLGSAFLLGSLINGGASFGLIAAASMPALFVPWFVSIRRFRRWQQRRAATRAARAATNGRSKPRSAGPDPDRLVVAWDALTVAARRERGRLVVARTSLDQFLLLADRIPLEPQAAEMTRLIRGHVPEMIDTCLDHCRLATEAERRVLIGDLVTSIESVAADADRRRPALMRTLRWDFDVQRADISQRTGQDPLSSA